VCRTAVLLRRWPTSRPWPTNVSQIRDEVLSLLKAMLPLTAELGTEPSDLVAEYQVKWTDGRWSPVDARAAISLHQQGRPVRQRRVTAWVEVDR
jgi:hypothetical protein